jgi:hypothetical protein
VFWLLRLTAWVRATRSASGKSPRIAFLRAQLTAHPEWQERVAATPLSWFATVPRLHAFFLLPISGDSVVSRQ